MKCLKSFGFFFCCFGILHLYYKPTTTNSNPTEKESMARQKGNVIMPEIAIVCDKDFGEIFSFNQTRILKYWEALFYDLNSRYKTLISIRVFFRVTSITIIKSAMEQRFVRTEKGQIDMDKTLDLFPIWIERKKMRMPKFDIIMLVTGAHYANGTLGMAYPSGACKPLGLNSLVVSIRYPSPVSVIVHEIAHMLGAQHDNETINKYGALCTSDFYIMYPFAKRQGRYFFSSCTDYAISKFVKSPEGNCLRELNASSQEVILDTSTFTNHASVQLSMEEQCRIITNSSVVFVKSDETSCKSARCWYNADGVKRVKHFSPFDGSRCGNNGRCSRGKCRLV